MLRFQGEENQQQKKKPREDLTFLSLKNLGPTADLVIQETDEHGVSGACYENKTEIQKFKWE